MSVELSFQKQLPSGRPLRPHVPPRSATVPTSPSSATVMFVTQPLCADTEPPWNLILQEILMNHFSSDSNELRFDYGSKISFCRAVNTDARVACPWHPSPTCQAFRRAAPPVARGAGRAGHRLQRGQCPGRSARRGPQGQHVDPFSGLERVPLAGGGAGMLFWVTIAIKHFVFGMSGVQEKWPLAGSFTALLIVQRARGPAVSSVKRRPDGSAFLDGAGSERVVC